MSIGICLEQDAVAGAPRRQHFAGLDGLRGVAAIVVVIAHVLEWCRLPVPPFAGLAVDFFFVLSGFVVSHAYEERIRAGRMTAGAFVAARLIRLHPLLVLGLTIGAALEAGRILFGSSPMSFAMLLVTYGAGLLCLPSHIVPGIKQAFPLDAPQWSLFAEYFVNLIFVLLIPILSNRLLVVVIAVAAVGLAGLALDHDSIEIGWRFTDAAWSLVRVTYPFFVGVGLARLHRTGRLPEISVPWWALALGLGAILLCPAVNGAAAVQLFASCVLFPAIIVSGRGRSTARAARALSWLGAISYPLYVLHGPIAIALANRAAHSPNAGLRMASAAAIVAIAIVAADLACRAFDIPARSRLRRYVHTPAIR